MKQNSWVQLLILSLAFISSLYSSDVSLKPSIGPYDKGALSFQVGDSKFDFATRLVLPEGFGAKNISLLNNLNHEDRTLYFRHTLDTSFHYGYGINCYGYEIIQLQISMRNRGVWGNPESIASTTENTVKGYEVRFGDHKHGIARHIWWIRELWVDLDLVNVFNFDFEKNHFVRLGAFSFQLGRGIALGDAYAVTPDPILGFSLEGSVDQYAFGGKIYGDIIKDCLGYDFYAAILNNKADGFGNTAAKIRGQQYGKKADQFRDFCIINFVLAGKLRWKPFDEENYAGYIEPYALYNRDPEQRVDFLGDAASNLYTVGMSGEFGFKDFEFGFDTAFNMGHQTVQGVDRNIISQETKNGIVFAVNTATSLVLNPAQPNQTTRKLPYRLAAKDASGKPVDVQTAVFLTPETQDQNGKTILSDITVNDPAITGTTGDVPAQVISGNNRFRNPYQTKFRGSMIVADMAFKMLNNDLRLTAAMGLATGDRTPNRDVVKKGEVAQDDVYEGFIGLQEIYSGTRVRSVFFLSGFSRVPRILDFPAPDVDDQFVPTVNRFTNIRFVGSGLWYRPKASKNKIDLNPNVLCYWQEHVTERFDLLDPLKKGMKVSPYLGLEANVIFSFWPSKDFRVFNKFAVFVPGQHYKDIKGLPITPSMSRYIDQLDRTGIVNDREPLLGDDTAFAANFGFEYVF